jgi:hypothetical protein
MFFVLSSLVADAVSTLEVTQPASGSHERQTPDKCFHSVPKPTALDLKAIHLTPYHELTEQPLLLIWVLTQGQVGYFSVHVDQFLAVAITSHSTEQQKHVLCAPLTNLPCVHLELARDLVVVVLARHPIRIGCVYNFQLAGYGFSSAAAFWPFARDHRWYVWMSAPDVRCDTGICLSNEHTMPAADT